MLGKAFKNLTARFVSSYPTYIQGSWGLSGSGLGVMAWFTYTQTNSSVG
jgi:hypothetical protein